MRIAQIRATPVTVPLEAPLRHANGCHWGRFVRTIVEVETDEGLVGLGEMGGGGESATAAFKGLKPYLLGRDPARLEELRFLIANPTASLYNNRTQLLAALEFACLDLLGQKWGVPVSEILGGPAARAGAVRVLPLLPLPEPEGGAGEVRSVEQLVAHAHDAEAAARLHQPQAEGRRVPARVRARVLPRARRGAARRSLSLRPERRVVDRAGHLVRPADRGPSQRLPGGPGLRPARHAPRAREGAHAARHEHRGGGLRAARGERARHGGRRDPARHHVLGRDPPLPQGRRRSARRSSSAWRSTPRASSASSWRRCCTWARCCRT